MLKFSKTQIDRLGDRLREGPLSDSDLRILDDYRRSFGEAYEVVVRTIREQLKLEPTGRSAKSTGSIIEKLHRESIRLSQVQDIAGCRIIVADVLEQDQVVALLRDVFPDTSVVDRRVHPSYGYRAVHVIVKACEKLIEIQVRSSLQHLWAELSEKFSDVVDPNIKYGGGKRAICAMLRFISDLVKDFENLEREQRKIPGTLGRMQSQTTIDAKKRKIAEGMTRMISLLETEKEQKP